MSETNVKTVKKIKKVVSEPNFIGVDLSKGNDIGTYNGEVTPKVVKKVKKIVKNEQIYYVHTCGYDYVVDTIDDDVAFSGTKDECDEWMKEHSIIEGLEDNTNPNEYMDDSPCDFSDFESGKVEMPKSTNVPTVKKVKKTISSNEYEGKQLVFTKVIDLDPKLYEDFTKEKYPYGLIFFDYEVFPLDWCVTFIDVIANKKIIIVNDRKGLLKFYQTHKDAIFVGYNNRNYDNNITKGIICGMNAKEVNDKLIVERLKGFQINNNFKDIQLYTFDCYKLGNSLKKLESFMQMNIEETQVDFNLNRYLNEKEWEQTLFYNEHDVKSTIEVFRKGQKGVYEGNMGLIGLYNFDISYINKTQAQLTEEILACEKPKEPRNDDWDLWLIDTIKLDKYKYVADWFMSLRNDHDRTRIETWKNGKYIDISKPKDKDKNKLEFHTEVCGVEHTFGLGGVHGAKEKFEVRKEKGIYHSDVNSLYPSIMIEYKLLTRNAKKPQEYKNAYDMRIKYKKEGNPLNKILKIPLNGAFGKMGDVESSAYDPLYVKMVPVTGQLLILTLLETLEPYIDLIQSNTDGIIYTLKKDEYKDKVFEIIKDWETTTRLGFTTDTIDYLIEKDVNNYLFNFSNGEVEVKGAYLKNTNDLDNDLPIVNECMREYILHKVNIEDYINSCDELWKFMKTFTLGGDYKFTTYNGVKCFNKCYRVFASKDLKSTALLKWKHEIGTILETVNSKGQLVKREYLGEKFAGQSDHVFIENGDIHGKKCSEYPLLDKQWYIDLVYDRLEDFGIDARPSMFEEFF
jgi:DNA polymerase